MIMGLFAWALPVMGATLIITCSTIFKPFREALKDVALLGELVVCPMCVGFWVGVVSSSLGSTLQPNVFLPLRMFADGCSAAVVCWTLHVALCALGQGRYLSSRPDLQARPHYHKTPYGPTGVSERVEAEIKATGT